jgi:tetratricopeptide (TPR) repeat protein
LWERTLEINDAFPAAHRNLGIAYFNKVNDNKLAEQHLEKAFSLDTTDARIVMELDQLYKRLNKTPEERLQLLEQHLPITESRDDLYLERIAIYNYLGAYEKAYELLMARKFHPWEGGEGKVPAQYKCSLIQMAKKLISKQNYGAALHYLELAQNYPENLGEGKLYGTPENEIFYWMGRAYKGLQQTDNAMASFDKATRGLSQPSAAIFYNDPQPDSIFYQGLSWEKLDCPERAAAIFSDLVHYGEMHLNDTVTLDYFAVSLPDLMVFDDNLSKRNKVHCLYMMGLGNLGLKKFTMAQTLFNEVFAMDAMHLGARIHAAFIQMQEQEEIMR